MGHVHQQEPAEEHADTSSPSSRPQGSGLDSLQPRLLSLLLYTLVQQSKISVCGASSFKNIKYKTLPYSISNHSIYKFIFSKKKKKSKRYSNSTQFKFFFSSLNFPKEEFQKQERVWSKGAIPRGTWGAQQSISVAFFCPESLWQGHSKVEDPGNSVLRRPSELKHPG